MAEHGKCGRATKAGQGHIFLEQVSQVASTGQESSRDTLPGPALLRPPSERDLRQFRDGSRVAQ
jgi:hypothetical protein